MSDHISFDDSLPLEEKLRTNANRKVFYRVYQFVTTFEKDPGKNKPFDTCEDFIGSDLKECKQRAIDSYLEKERVFNSGKFFLPFHGYEWFEFGKHAAFSITLSIVLAWPDGYEEEYVIEGEDEETNIEGQEMESEIFSEMGIK